MAKAPYRHSPLDVVAWYGSHVPCTVAVDAAGRGTDYGQPLSCEKNPVQFGA